MASNDPPGSQQYTPSESTKSFVVGINKQLQKFAKENNQMTREDKQWTIEQINKSTNEVFVIHLIDFYAKPEDLQTQIELLCENNQINSKKIVSCLVDKNGRNGRDPKFIFQTPEDVQRKLREIEKQESDPFYTAISKETDRINWNTDFPNIKSEEDDFDNRNKQIQENIHHFLRIHKQDLPSIQTETDFLPKKIFVMMAAVDGGNCVMRKYEFNKNKKTGPFFKRFNPIDCSLLLESVDINKEMCRFDYRAEAEEDKINFVLDKKDIIYLLQIRFPVYECKAENETGYRNLYYVGKASRGLLDRWLQQSTSHLKHVLEVWNQMNASSTELSGALSHLALAYAHMMGYETQLFIVDQVTAHSKMVEKMNNCIKKTEALITEANKAKKKTLADVWYDHKAKEKTASASGGSAEGSTTRLMTTTEEELPPLVFVNWYKDYKEPKPTANSIIHDELEQRWIERMESTADRNGFNSTNSRPSHLPIEYMKWF